MYGAERSKSLGTFEFNPFAAGSKTYNQVGSSPNIGPVNKAGYKARDRKLSAKRNAVLARMKASNAGAYASPDFMRFL